MMAESHQRQLITIEDPVSPASEAYRTLRMNLQFAALDVDLCTLLVTSPGANEGKSTILANLGVTMAQIGQRVTLVDCDLRRPSLHEFFGRSNDTGLTSMVVEEHLFERPPLRETGVENLHLLPSGPLPPRPSDLLGSQRMSAVLEELLQDADILLLDAPPIMAATDAAVLATKVEGVLLVVSAGATKREQAQRAVERLNKVNANIVGAVLNNARLETGMQGYYQ